MYDGDGYIAKKPQCHEPRLAIAKSVIGESERRPLEHAGRIGKVESVWLEVRAALGFVPRESH